jgi:hypothetical protein
MTLPKIEYPLSLIRVHSLNRDVKFRPFLVKEEKLLLIAKESKDPDEIRLAIIQIIQNCACEPLDVDKLPLFDIEMIFVKIRAKSVGESVKLVYTCYNEVNGEPCNENTDYTVDLSKVTLEIPEGHSNKIMITDTVGIILKYPTLESGTPLLENEDAYDRVLKMIMDNTECIFDKEVVYKPETSRPEELVEFMSNLTIEHMTLIQEFFTTGPKVVLTDKVTCKKCGYEHMLNVEGLISFFI